MHCYRQALQTTRGLRKSLLGRCRPGAILYGELSRHSHPHSTQQYWVSGLQPGVTDAIGYAISHGQSRNRIHITAQRFTGTTAGWVKAIAL